MIHRPLFRSKLDKKTHMIIKYTYNMNYYSEILYNIKFLWSYFFSSLDCVEVSVCLLWSNVAGLDHDHFDFDGMIFWSLSKLSNWSLTMIVLPTPGSCWIGLETFKLDDPRKKIIYHCKIVFLNLFSNRSAHSWHHNNRIDNKFSICFHCIFEWFA